ncbi:Copper amine oxidase domain protein [uncultured Eubacteriales bacterium]|uniref:Copper amine oxidase domain protein n=1 Tax=uncultured Eubacteriales bacterium TaxID=172733 RepID=A0A212JJM5_9FIRM|nr:Copper amine oxidase domain protein [uncultured Eubacteriales bacterium]
MMRRCAKLAFGLFLALALGVGAHAADLRVNGVDVHSDVAPRVIGGSTYVSLRAVTQALRGDAALSWEGQAVVRGSGITLTAAPGACYLEANGRALYIANGIQAETGRLLVPVRVLAKALGAEVYWDAATGDVNIQSGSGTITSGDAFYNANDLYWLSHIISAESQGEPLVGKIAVGNVILNRVKSDEFPNTIYDVIFDSAWGVQFTPVANGTIYQEPTAESVLAAKLCLDGANTAGSSLYFLAPALTNSRWAAQNRPYVTTIGAHQFYG